MPYHLALLGDSVFDNGAYVPAGTAVRDQLQRILEGDWKVSLFAVDGSTTADFVPQLAKVPGDATHLVISIGGNDAILNADLLGLPVSSTAEALALFGERAARFEANYRSGIAAALALGLPTTVCTVYNGNLSPQEAALARTALTLFNDAILRVAFEHGLSVLDLRLICDESTDYANPIEPSIAGGQKIAKAIVRLLAGSGEGAANARVMAR
jgi:lysophospholipase L1-like esterase